MRVLNDADEVAAAAGEDLGVSEWVEISQERIDAFADATGDHQWIHVDPEKAAGGPFGTTIAHGYLTLSMVPLLGAQVFAFAGEGAKINYGLNKVRFPAPVPVDSRVRARVQLAEVTEIPSGQQVILRYAIEIDGGKKPACVAETVVLLLAP
ncbi:MAG: MaoC family dehydratase [Nocardioidaceae bacterium]|jgi:acyl dehydratase|nr:MaoC family dehydratase [Nocardioidaceae bacterium]